MGGGGGGDGFLDETHFIVSSRIFEYRNSISQTEHTIPSYSLHVTEEDFETTEGESVDLCDKLTEMTGWIVTDEENHKNKPEWLDLIFVQ